MKCCTGDYHYKGFLIRFSDYHQIWDLEASYLGDSEKIDKVKSRLSYPAFKTINQAKKWIKENETKLKENISKILDNN